MPKCRTLALIATLNLAAAVLGQRTWTVAPPGATADFHDLPPAVAAAATGDTIVVRGGTFFAYTPITITRGLTIVGIPDPLPQLPEIIVRDIPSTEEVRISGLVVFAVRPRALRIERCDGNVMIDKLSLVSASPTWAEIEGCRQVSLRGCELGARDGAHRIVDSRVVATRSDIDTIITTATGTAAVRLIRSELELVDTMVTATSVTFTPRIAVRMEDSRIMVAGSTRFSSGPAPFPAFQAPCTGPSLVVAPPGHGLSSLGCVRIVDDWVPAVSVAQPVRGNPMAWSVHGRPGSLHLLFAGLAQNGPIRLQPGELWLQPTAPIEFIGWASPDATGRASGRVGRVPQALGRGTALAFQSVELLPGGGGALSLRTAAIVR